MSWGISKNASEKEKLKAEINDFFQGLNSVGDIDYTAYSAIYDVVMPIIDNMYKRMEHENNESDDSKNSRAKKDYMYNDCRVNKILDDAVDTFLECFLQSERDKDGR